MSSLQGKEILDMYRVKATEDKVKNNRRMS